MVVNHFWILWMAPINEKLGIGLEKNICQWKEDKNFAETGRGSYYQEEWLEELLDSKDAFYIGNENDNDDERYNENNEQQ